AVSTSSFGASSGTSRTGFSSASTVPSGATSEEIDELSVPPALGREVTGLASTNPGTMTAAATTPATTSAAEPAPTRAPIPVMAPPDPPAPPADPVPPAAPGTPGT